MTLNIQYLETVNKSLGQLGYEVEGFDCTDKSAEWYQRIKQKNVDGREMNKLYKILQNQDFLVIYCHSKDMNSLGGDVSFFINKKNGEILYTLRGQ